MTASSSRDDIQLLFWGDASTFKRLNTFVHGSVGRFSGYSISHMLTLKDLEQSLKTDQPTIALLALEKKWDHDLDLITQNLNPALAQIVLMTNTAAVRDAAHAAGITLTCQNDRATLQSAADILGLAQEVLTLKYNQQDLLTRYEAAEQRFKDVADQFADWLWEMDTDLILKFSSARRSPGQKIEVGNAFSDAFLLEEKTRILDDFADLIAHPRPFHDRDYWSADAHGSRICWSVSGIPVNDTRGRLVGFRGVARDISAQKASTDQLYFLSNHDPLTGCHNRARFFDEMARSLRINTRDKRSSAFVAIGLDQFHVINETYGHAIGDKALIHCSEILKDHLRTGDFLARLGGDEFGVLLNDVTKAEAAQRLDELMASFKNRPLMHIDGAIQVRSSIGVSVYPAGSDGPDDVLRQGLHALQKAKEKGRHRIEFFSEGAAPFVQTDKLSWVDLLMHRLEHEKDALILNYQPIVKIGDDVKNAHFYEVLVRLLDEDGVPCPPHKFIETAEDFGLIRKLDEQVALRAIERLSEAQKADENLRLSVNLSGKTFADDAVRETILSAIKEAKLPHKSFVIEITESNAKAEMENIKDFMKALKPHGVGFALDDCGGGFSSFKTVQQLDIDFLKIDGSYVRNLHTNSESKAFVEAIQHIASEKGVQTIAEMVENKDIADTLQEMKIDYGQGFYFSAPLAQIK